MQYLLDTHTVLWFLSADDKLPEALAQTIENPDNECRISMASYWEMAIKLSLGKLKLDVGLQELYDIIGHSGILPLPIDPYHLLVSASLPFHHRDPFDRIMIAQSVYENLPIISKDGAFKQYDVDVIWD